MRVLSFIKNVDLLKRYPPYLSMIATEVEQFHLCHIAGKFREESIIFHQLQIPKIIHFSSLLLALPTALKAFKICRRYKINIIYVLDSIYYELSGLITAMLSRTPLVIRLRTNEVKLRSILRYNFIKRFLGNFVTMLAVNNAKQVVCISHELRDLVLGWGLNPSRVKIVYHGVDANQFRPMKVEKPFSKIVLFVGGFAPGKGASIVIEVAKCLENIHFLIIGSKSDDSEISRLPKNIHFLGIVSRDHMPLYYNMCDVLVLPSFTEGFPDVILEALACGKPVIASRVGEIPWIVSSKFGWLVEPGNVKEFKETIQNALSDEGLLKAMGEAAREYVVKNFRWCSYAKEMTNILKTSYD